MTTTGHIQDIYTLTPMQEGMLFHSLYDDSSSSYFQQISYRINGDFEVEVVKKSLALLFRRHEILRTSFVHQSSKRPVQVVLKERKPEVYNEDLRQLYPGQEQAREELIQSYKKKDRERSFDLTRDVLLRLAILRLDNREYEVIWSYHHILLDAWSTAILVSEFFTIYLGFMQGKTPQLPHVKPYRDYIQWLESQDKKESRDYWRQFLEGYEEAAGIPQIDSMHSQESVNKAYKNAVFYFYLDSEKTADINHLAVENQVSLSTLLQTLWGIFLGKYNRKHDVVFGLVVSGRPSEIQNVETMVGLFINTIPVRITFAEKTPLNQVFRQVQQKSLDSEPYHFCPLAEIQAQSPLKHHLINHLFIFENRPVPQRIQDVLPGEKSNQQRERLGVEKNEVFEQTNYDFNFYIAPAPNLILKIAYNEYIYHRELVEKISHNFQHLVDQVLENPEITIKDLTILSEEERSRILYEFNNTSKEYQADTPIHELFQQVVEKNPGHAALVFGEKHFTYRELDLRSNSLAAFLQEKGIGSSCTVGVMTERSLEMLVGMMAVLKAGAAYIPLDPAFPRERIQYMLQESDTAMLLTLEDFITHDRGISFNGEILELKDLQLYQGMDTTLENRVFSSQPAYIIYTSGSTGKPKGVIVEHQNVVNFNRGIISRIPFSPGKAILALTTISFDIFVLETFLPLLNSLKVVIANEDQQRDPALLGEVIVKHRLDMIQVTPSTLHMLLGSEGGSHCLKGVKELMVGGEAFPVHLFTQIKKTFNGRIYNMYGPTETTVWSAVKDLTLGETIDIGTPISNTQVFIMDGYNQLLPVGAVGELCIGGDGVARGYLNNPELTAEKFDRDKKNKSVCGGRAGSPGLLRGAVFPKSAHFVAADKRIYKTGDLARWLRDGNIQFLGRIDQQVKVRGFRIELGEIESRLLSHQDIKEAVVVIKEDDSADKFICAYIVSHPGKVLSDTKLREYLAGKLPYYMIPSYISQLDHIPLTPNSKIDRKALPEPEKNAREGYAAPTNEIEEKLVKIWSEVLEIPVERIGIHHNFFILGGHSLKAVFMVSKIHKIFNVKVILSEMLKIPKIREMAQYLKSLAEDKYVSIKPVEKKEYFQLSSAQKRLYILHKIDENSTRYNVTKMYVVEGDMNKERLVDTFTKLIKRHESLRTSFELVNEEPVQRIHDNIEFEIEYHEIGETGNRRKNTGIEEIIHDFSRPIDLSQAPLLNVSIIKSGEARYILMLNIHHIISDGISMEILIREFTPLYLGKKLPYLNIQYKDYSYWQNDLIESKEMKKQEEYWLKRFERGVPLLKLPVDYDRIGGQGSKGNILRFELYRTLTGKVKEVMSQTGATLFMVLLAAYNVLLFKYTGSDDILVGSPIAGRPSVDLKNIVGMFVNMLALRNSPQKNKTFKDFLSEVKQNALHAYENQDYQFDQLAAKLKTHGDSSLDPLINTVFTLQNIDSVEINREGNESHGMIIKAYPLEANTTKFDLTLDAFENNGTINMWLTYCTGLFKKSTIDTIKQNYIDIIEQVVKNIDIQIKNISISHNSVAAKGILKGEQGDFAF